MISVYKNLLRHFILTVILNGDGADELFGGYRRYVLANAPFNVFNNNRWIKLFLNTLMALLPKPKTKLSLNNYLNRLNIISHFSVNKHYRMMLIKNGAEVKNVDSHN